jgi:phosphatidylglycerol lysyltransferase
MQHPRGGDEWLAARALVVRSGWNAVSYQILNPGIRHWFSRAGDAVIGYANWAGVRVVAGAPVCNAARLADANAEFERDAHDAGEHVLFMAAGARMENCFAGRDDHSFVYVGAQPVWNPLDWPAIVRRKASLRAQLHRARNKGVSVDEWPADRAQDSPELHAVLDDWLSHRGLPPLHFLTTPELLGNLRDRRTFVAALNGRAIAYLIATPIPARSGWLVEAWPRTRNAPNGTTHLLVHTAMCALADAGARYVTLGIAPLSEHGERHYQAEPPWLRWTLRWIRAHGRRFYNFRGLEAFKAGLQPSGWEPLFAIADAPRFTPRHLHAVAGVFSGGSPALFLGRALAHALAEEVNRGRGRSRSRGRSGSRPRQASASGVNGSFRPPCT